MPNVMLTSCFQNLFMFSLGRRFCARGSLSPLCSDMRTLEDLGRHPNCCVQGGSLLAKLDQSNFILEQEPQQQLLISYLLECKKVLKMKTWKEEKGSKREGEGK